MDPVVLAVVWAALLVGFVLGAARSSRAYGRSYKDGTREERARWKR